MKKCSRCKLDKDEKEFYNLSSSIDGLTSKCKNCHKELSKKSYYKNQQYYLDKAKIKNKNTRVIYRTNIIEYLQNHPCVDCGISDIRVLEFDHVRGDKKLGISDMDTFSWETVLKEIAKCEVVCANCHKIRTYTRCNSYRTK